MLRFGLGKFGDGGVIQEKGDSENRGQTLFSVTQENLGLAPIFTVPLFPKRKSRVGCIVALFAQDGSGKA